MAVFQAIFNGYFSIVTQIPYSSPAPETKYRNCFLRRPLCHRLHKQYKTKTKKQI